MVREHSTVCRHSSCTRPYIFITKLHDYFAALLFRSSVIIWFISINIFNHLKPGGHYMCHLFQHAETLRVIRIFFVLRFFICTDTSQLNVFYALVRFMDTFQCDSPLSILRPYTVSYVFYMPSATASRLK
jgi:hypothetical protein